MTYNAEVNIVSVTPITDGISVVYTVKFASNTGYSTLANVVTNLYQSYSSIGNQLMQALPGTIITVQVPVVTDLLAAPKPSAAPTATTRTTTGKKHRKSHVRGRPGVDVRVNVQ